MDESKKKIQTELDRLGSLQSWNHNFQLPHGLTTSNLNQESHGKNLTKFARLKPILDLFDLRDKHVLDLGCNEGFFSFMIANMHAKVTGLDIDDLRIEKAKYIQTLLDQKGRISFENTSIYSEDFSKLPDFDICLCLGFLHRIPDPFSAIEALAKKSNVFIFEWKSLKHGDHHDPIAYFSEKDIDSEDYYGTEYWLLSYSAVERILERNGIKYFYRIDDPSQKRGILIASREENNSLDALVKTSYRSIFLILGSHTKRFLKTLFKIFTKKINA